MINRDTLERVVMDLTLTNAALLEEVKALKNRIHLKISEDSVNLRLIAMNKQLRIYKTFYEDRHLRYNECLKQVYKKIFTKEHYDFINKLLIKSTDIYEQLDK